jgi:hypothetical protein
MTEAEKLVAEFKEASWIASDNRVIRTEDGTWFIAEVTYVDGMPAGYTSPCLVADTLEGMYEVMDMVSAALKRPVLPMEAFK